MNAGLCILLAGYCRYHDHLQGFIDGEDEAECRFPAGIQASKTFHVRRLRSHSHLGRKVPRADSGRHLRELISLLANWMVPSAGMALLKIDKCYLHILHKIRSSNNSESEC